MICDKKVKPEFSTTLLTECIACHHASKNTIIVGETGWCCKFGFWLKELSNIILPNKQIKYPPVKQQVKNFTGSMKDFAKSGFKIRSKVEQLKCTAICESNKCGMYNRNKIFPNRCKACGCCTSLSKLIESKKCPLNFF